MIVVGIIRGQPRDDSAMRKFLAPSGICGKSCFMGIHPGITTREQAVVILQAHPWVGTITMFPGAVVWAWNGEQPAFLSASFDERIASGQVYFRDNIVAGINISTSIAWGDFFYALGVPDEELFARVYTDPGSDLNLAHLARYSKLGFAIQTYTSCPLKRHSVLWYSTGLIIWNGNFRANYVRNC